MNKCLSLLIGLIICVCLTTCGKLDRPPRKRYVRDYLEPALSSAQVTALLRELPLRDIVLRYPSYTRIPKTGFRCLSKAGPGYYADLETGCQVFHRCDPFGRQSDFLCAASTIFNQITLVCDAWYDVNCRRLVVNGDLL